MKKVLGISLLIIGILLIIFFIPQKREPSVVDLGTVGTYTPEEIIAYASFQPSVENPDTGTYVIRGQIDLPTPCWTLEASARVMESFPEQVSIDFQAEADEDVVCVQVITPTNFEVTFNTHKDASVRATFNGRPVDIDISSAEVSQEENIISEE